MTRSMSRIGVLLIAFAGLVCAPGAAQQEQKRDRSGGYTAILDNLDMLVDNYAKFLGRKYDLTEEQYNFTADMLRQKANDFIDKHDGEIRDLFDQMFDARAGGTMSPEQLVEWGKRVSPIYDEAKKIVTESNEEWRSMLDDRQKSIHDGDLKLMKTSFETTDSQLQRIVTGEMTVDEFVNPNRYNNSRRARQRQSANVDPAAGAPAPAQAAPTPSNAQPAGDGLTPEQAAAQAKLEALDRQNQLAEAAAIEAKRREESGEAPPPADQEQPVHQPPPQPQGQPVPEPADPGRPDRGRDRGGKVNAKNFESEWQKYVREFIDRYQLNEAQSQKANAFLDEAERRAQQAVGAKQTELEQLDKREGELKGAAARGKDNPAAKELAELAKKREAIVAPLGKIFEELKDKLEKLPTRAQRKSAEDAAKKPAPKPGGRLAKPAGGEKP